MKKSVPALRYTFRFDVAWAEATVSSPTEALGNVIVAATASSSRCDCLEQVERIVVSSVGPIGPRVESKTVDVIVELRSGSGSIPAGWVSLYGHLVPFAVVATPPLQEAQTAPSPGTAHSAGAATLSQITFEVLPA